MVDIILRRSQPGALGKQDSGKSVLWSQRPNSFRIRRFTASPIFMGLRIYLKFCFCPTYPRLLMVQLLIINLHFLKQNKAYVSGRLYIIPTKHILEAELSFSQQPITAKSCEQKLCGTVCLELESHFDVGRFQQHSISFFTQHIRYGFTSWVRFSFFITLCFCTNVFSLEVRLQRQGKKTG